MPDDRVSATDLTGIAETSLIPLIARAQARARFPDLGFADPAAERILRELDVDPARHGQHVPTMRGAIIRAQAFDRIAAAFAAAHPEGLTVSLGAGLDTRAERTGTKTAWADVDLPAVARLRERLLPVDGGRLIAGSVTDPSWAGKTGWEPGQPVLLLAEAVLFFLPPAEVHAFLDRLPGQFPTGAEIAFDYAAPLMVRNASRHPGLKNTDARFQWSARGARQITRAHPDLRVLADRDLAGSSVSPGAGGHVLAAISRVLRLAAGGWMYGLAHLAIDPAPAQASPPPHPANGALPTDAVRLAREDSSQCPIRRRGPHVP